MRTCLFDLQYTTAEITEATRHLPSVTVAVMGCIVNRPGESTDADYRYAGSIHATIDLYCGEEVVRKKVLESETVDELVDFIINID